MKMVIHNGIFIMSDTDIACFMTGFNLFKNVSNIQDIGDILMEGARAHIYTKDYALVHPFVKSLLRNNYVGEFVVDFVDGDLKETVLTPVLGEMLRTNNAITQTWNGLFSPKGYMTINAFDFSKVDLYTLDAKSGETNYSSEVNTYDVRGRKLYRYAIPNKWAV